MFCSHPSYRDFPYASRPYDVPRVLSVAFRPTCEPPPSRDPTFSPHLSPPRELLKSLFGSPFDLLVTHAGQATYDPVLFIPPRPHPVDSNVVCVVVTTAFRGPPFATAGFFCLLPSLFMPYFPCHAVVMTRTNILDHTYCGPPHRPTVFLEYRSSPTLSATCMSRLFPFFSLSLPFPPRLLPCRPLFPALSYVLPSPPPTAALSFPTHPFLA